MSITNSSRYFLLLFVECNKYIQTGGNYRDYCDYTLSWRDRTEAWPDLFADSSCPVSQLFHAECL